jgi:hypothetical protein
LPDAPIFLGFGGRSAFPPKRCLRSLFCFVFPTFPGKDWLRVGLWAALGWALFRYWPVKREAQSPETVQFAETVSLAPSVPTEGSTEPENP